MTGEREVSSHGFTSGRFRRLWCVLSTMGLGVSLVLATPPEVQAPGKTGPSASGNARQSVPPGTVPAPEDEAGPAANQITLGEFYMDCVAAFGIRLPTEAEPDDAWLALRGAGLDLTVDEKTDLDQALRQGHVLEMGRLLGLKQLRGVPERIFTRQQEKIFMQRFRSQFRLPDLASPENSSPEEPPQTRPQG